ncbi:hypothetical protein DUI87_26170 [Hirundo rustica rustica]|uniref:HSF-type DNA-binding domain-containing protein n=1 Tax=Hirundo rustica rustica TaxID=333673 RepID=A0A3M0J8U7_HIRRU|nr:hypothetical protein DUI87_26170 [Hirundo rustica rustica]
MAAVICKGRARFRSLVGCDFACIYMPLATTEELELLLQNNDNLQFALDIYPGKISIHILATNYLKQSFIWFPNSFKGYRISQKKAQMVKQTVIYLGYERFLKHQAIMVEQDDVEIVVTNTVNPASFLSGSMGEPVIHECLEAIEATCSSCLDLKDTLLENTETWSTDGSSCVISGRHAGPGGAQGPAPHAFRATQFSSFVRQLYRYGFRKVPGRAGAAAPGDAGAWLHYTNPWFRRDRPDLLLRIRRRGAANTQRPAAGPEGRRLPPCGSQQLPGPRPLPDERHGRARFQPLPRERPPLARCPPCGFHLLHRERPGPARREGPSRFQELYGERPLPAERELLRVPPCHFQGFHGEQLLPPRWEGPRSRMQELYGEQPPPLDRELLWMQPCSFQELHREQQSPASNPPAAPGTSAPHAPAGSAGCAASTASSSAQNAPAQEESPPLDLGLEIEKMIHEIRNSLPVKAPSAQGNINVAPESPGEDPMNRAAAEEVSSGTESCRNSSPEPEEPAVPEETLVDQERGTRDPCCRPPSPDNVPLPDELEEDPDDGAEPLAEPMIGLKELTDQIQAVMQRVDEQGQEATKLLLEKPKNYLQ